jgi:CheY-like chemotaxis protein
MKGRLLLCDDEIPILKAAEFKLTRAGFEVRLAYDGQEAWEAIAQQMPDLVVTDYQMPRLNGLQLIGRLRAQPATQRLPIILLTGKGLELDRRHLEQEYQLAAVLSKPFSPRDVLQRVETALHLATSTIDPSKIVCGEVAI